MSGRNRKRRPHNWDGAPQHFSLAADLHPSAAAALAGAADLALATGDVVVIEGTRTALVPDTVIIELLANGEALEPATRMMRDDGRLCHVYRVPEGVAL